MKRIHPKVWHSWFMSRKKEHVVEVHDIDYFIKAFETLEPKDFTLSSVDNEPRDAWEWLTVQEAQELYAIIEPYGILLEANDGLNGWECYGDDIQTRVLGFLEYVRAGIFSQSGSKL